MARYIDVDKLIEEYDRVHIGAPGGARKLMEESPEVDVAEVVRCKDCTHKVDYCGRIMCDKNARRLNDGIVGLRATNSEDFCSYGERKAE